MGYERHHVIPRSRGGKGKRTTYLPAEFHHLWHELFVNLKPWEIENFVKEINAQMYVSKIITPDDIDRIRSKNLRRVK